VTQAYEDRFVAEIREIERRATAGDLPDASLSAIADAMLVVAPVLGDETRRAAESLVRAIQDRIGARAIAP